MKYTATFEWTLIFSVKYLGKKKNLKGLAFCQLAFARSCARKWFTLSIVHKARAIPSSHNFAVCYLSDFWKNGYLLYTHNSPNQYISSEQLENCTPIANQPFTIPASTYFPLQFIWQSWSKSFKMFQDTTKSKQLRLCQDTEISLSTITCP